jgi:small-conductance mechanosensitive channel
VVAFGITFAYPVFVPWIRRTHPAAMPAIHDAQDRLGRMLQTPGMVVVLLAGIYLASDADVWDQLWVTVPLVILVVIFGLGGAFFAPKARELGALARRDLAARGELSPEYDALLTRVLQVGVTTAMLVLVAIFFMVAKP